MTAQQLRNSILQEAISGRLVPQDPNDEPASVLLEKIRQEKANLVKEGKLKKKDIEETPISENEIPFEIPESWEWCRFFSVFKLETNLVDPLQYTNHIHVAPDNIEKRTGRLKPCRTVKEDHVKSNNHLFHQGQIIYSKIRPLLRKVIIAPFDGLCSADMYPLSTIMDTKFALHFLLSETFNNQVSTICSSRVKMPKINQEELASTIVPLPPVAEQKRIVAKLEELLPIVEQYGKAQQELDELNANLPQRLRQSVLQEAIQGKLVPQDPNDEPASVLLEKIRAEKAQLVKEGKLKKKDLEETPISEDEIPFEIPESWEWCRLGDLAFERMGKTPPRGESEYWDKAKYPWVSISDMKNYGHIQKTKECVSEIAAQRAFRFMSPVGSLLMSFKLTVGRTSILDIAAYHNEAIITILPFFDREYAFRNYLFYILPLVANSGDSKDAIKGKTLNSTSLYNLYIPLPPLAEQKRIVAKIEELFELIDKIK